MAGNRAGVTSTLYDTSTRLLCKTQLPMLVVIATVTLPQMRDYTLSFCLCAIQAEPFLRTLEYDLPLLSTCHFPVLIRAAVHAVVHERWNLLLWNLLVK